MQSELHIAPEIGCSPLNSKCSLLGLCGCFSFWHLRRERAGRVLALCCNACGQSRATDLRSRLLRALSHSTFTKSTVMSQ